MDPALAAGAVKLVTSLLADSLCDHSYDVQQISPILAEVGHRGDDWVLCCNASLSPPVINFIYKFPYLKE